MLTEARGLLLKGWCQDAYARDERGRIVLPWSDQAASWSLLGAMLATWQRHDEQLNVDFAAHSAEASAVGDATSALIAATGSPSLEDWNDAFDRRRADVIAAVDEALELTRPG
ncbi:MAG TPA: hypothetical protein VGJ40_05990 [Gaiellaceae bacterium]|jgi:hypothetical protein